MREDKGRRPLSLDDEPTRRRQPHAGDAWNIVKWVFAAIGTLVAVGAFFATNILQTAALAGLACFAGILSRLAQAEQHRYPL